MHQAGCGREQRCRGSENYMLISEWAKVYTAWWTTTGQLPPAWHVRLQRDHWRSPPELGSSCTPRKRLRALYPTNQTATILIINHKKGGGKQKMIKKKYWCIFIIYSHLLKNSTKFQLNWIWNKIYFKTAQYCRDIEVWSRSLTVVWTDKARWVVPSCKVWHLWHTWYPKKSQC